ncbi:D-alanine--D-alanine ligase, partial [Methylobacterium radiotolerans]
GRGDKAWTALRAVTDRILGVADDITVALVANSKGAVSSDPGDRSTEYLSDGEANQLLTGLRSAGFRTRYFDGERAFIEQTLTDPTLGTHGPRLLVYNIAQSGTDAGRKSLVPAFCALQGIATCNSNAYVVSLARNKLHVHSILKRFGLSVPDSWSYQAGSGWLLGRRPSGDATLIAKAIHESASIGLDGDSIGRAGAEYETMLARKSRTLRQAMFVQRLVAGREMETPVVRVGGQVHVLGPAIVTLGGTDHLGSRILDYDSVAHDDYGYAVPGPAEAPVVAKVRRVAAAAYETLGLEGFARVDFRVDDAGRPFVIDVATSPHLVWHSAYAHVFRAAGWGHEEMLACMVAVNARRLGWI